jgi:hypothetical protein
MARGRTASSRELPLDSDEFAPGRIVVRLPKSAGFPRRRRRRRFPALRLETDN